MERLLEGLSAIVYGGSGRIGGTVARTLVSYGARVAIQYRNGRETAELLAKELDSTGRRAIAVHADCNDEASLTDAVRDVQRFFGSLDLVVNCVHGTFAPVLVAEACLDDWKPHLEALEGHFLVCRTALPVLRSQGHGRIVFLSAGLAVRYGEGFALFTAIKKGLHGFCQTLAREEGRNGILVNIVAPGGLANPEDEKDDVPFQGADGDPWLAMKRDILDHSALGRLASAQEVADAVVFFASPLAKGITGQILYVSGGEIMS